MNSCKVLLIVFLTLIAGVCVCSCQEDGQDTQDNTRHYEFRAIGGFSMGSVSAAVLGLRFNDKFDIVMPLGGAIDLGLFANMIREELFSGFCVPPEAGRMCPNPEYGQDYEHMDCGGPAGGGFHRKSMVEAFQDASIAMGNLVSFNPQNGYLPAGVPDSYLALSRQEKCSQPVRLENFHDWQYNPDGSSPVITYCEGNGPEQGVFDPSVTPDYPVEIALAVDLNDNGLRDSGEPVLNWSMERFDDIGEDGVASTDEPGYDPDTNPDPEGDDYEPLGNPLGTEGNHHHDNGEPYLDYGLDGVPNTASNGYDWGESNDLFDYNPNLFRTAYLYDPRRMVEDLTTDQLARLDFYIDVGIRDHLRFRPTCESFAGTLGARGRPVDIRDGFKSLLPDGEEDYFDVHNIDWDQAGRDVMVRYGDPDASQAEIDAGDGGHVGNGAQVLWRFWTSVAYLSARWPDGDFEKLGPEISESRVVEAFYPSQILGKDWSYHIYLPPGYDENPDKRYPVLFMIHGIGMKAEDLTVSALFTEDWMRTGFMQKFIMVFPNGRCEDDCFSGNFFANQIGRDQPPNRYEDSFIQELIPHLDETYRTKHPKEIEVRQP